MRHLRAPLAAWLVAVLPWGAWGAEAARTRVIRGWPDEVVVEGQRQRVRVEVVFDYGSGRTQEVSYGADGGELQRRLLPLGFQPAPCAEELAEARDAVRSDRELQAILRRTGGEPQDGSLLQQPEGPCGPGSRCLLVPLATADRTGVIRFVVYNLTAQAFVSRDYTPASAATRP
jgi:hypothetical protein